MTDVPILFPVSVKKERWRHCGGICEGPCGLRIQGRPEYHHFKERGLGGKGTFENCRVYCKKCHRHVTKTQSIPLISKADRMKQAHVTGIYPRKQKIPSRGFQKWNE
jgi:hypothetical protein